MPEYQQMSAIAMELREVLMAEAARSEPARAAVAAFQHRAIIEPTDGTFGPVTRQALGFFLPDGQVPPCEWPGTRPGTWSPEPWLRRQEVTVTRVPWGLVALLGVFLTAGAIAVVGVVKE